MQVYTNPKTGRVISKQRAHQIANISAGKCQHHKDRPIAGYGYLCEECVAKRQKLLGVMCARGKHLDWSVVNLHGDTRLIAKELNVPESTVYNQQRSKGIRNWRRRLNAAAPELLAALQEAKETIKALHGDIAWDTYDKCSPEMKRLNAAIAKATGEDSK